MRTAVDDLILDLAKALLDEEAARGAVRTAQHQQAALLHRLREAGLPATRVAHRLATARRLTLPLVDRVRFAERLRKAAWRRTRCPADLPASHGAAALPILPSNERALPPKLKESEMKHLVKRVVTTEEWVDSKDLEVDELDAADDGDDDEDLEEEEEPEVEERPKRRASSRR